MTGQLSARLSEARNHAWAFARYEVTAVDFERALLDLGFYNVEFSPPAATYLGVRYPLTLAGVKL